MYIPSMFFGKGGDCATFAFTGSVPPNTATGFVSASDGEYFFVRSELTEFAFEITGSTSSAKLILGGGGGRANVFNFNPLAVGESSAGGGGAGEVLIQDIYLSPGLYFVSASAGGSSGSYGQEISDGDATHFIVRQDLPQPEQTLIIARGGKQNDEDTGGKSGNLNDGGLPIGVSGGTITAGGGGGGSTQDGQDAYNTPGVGNAKTGGDGGTGSLVPSAFVTIMSSSFIGIGGPGQGYGGNDGGTPGGIVNAYSNGGMAQGQQGGDGQRGVFALFIPKSNCETGSSETFATSSTLEGVCQSAGNTNLFYDGNTYNGLQIGATLFNDKYLSNPVSNSYIISSSNEVFLIGGSNGVISSQDVCSTTIALASGSDTTTACSSSVQNNYYHTGSFTAGNTVYSDFNRTTTVPNNFYKDPALNVSQTISGVLQTSTSCPPIFTTFPLVSGSNSTEACSRTSQRDFYTATGSILSVGNTLFNDTTLSSDVGAQFFRTSGSIRHFNTNGSGVIISSGSICINTFRLNFADTNVCTASLVSDFYTQQGTSLTVGNTLFTDTALSQTTASLFKTSGSNVFFETDTNGEITSSGSICPDSCETYNFNGGPSSDNTGSATLCGTTASVDFFVPPNTTVSKCVQVGTAKNLTGVDSQIIFVAQGCVSQWPLFYNETNACTSSLSATFYTTGSTELTVGNILYTNNTRSATTASLFRTSGSNLFFETNVSGEITSSGSACVNNCESYNFNGGPSSDNTGSFVPCGETGSIDFNVPANSTVNKCVQSGSAKNLTGGGSNIQFVSTC